MYGRINYFALVFDNLLYKRIHKLYKNKISLLETKNYIIIEIYY